LAPWQIGAIPASEAMAAGVEAAWPDTGFRTERERAEDASRETEGSVLQGQ
jgi:hypothetical protein